LASKPGLLHRILIWMCWVSFFMASIFLINFLIDPEAKSTKRIEVIAWFGLVALAIALIVGWLRRK
jgi:hypothetical protein